MPKGGKRAGAGRPRGAVNQRTRTFNREIKRSGLTPLEYMLKVMRDSHAKPERRDWAAAAAAPYIHPRLQSIEVEHEASELPSAQIDLLTLARQVALMLYLADRKQQSERVTYNAQETIPH